jgi:hypothetical protein
VPGPSSITDIVAARTRAAMSAITSDRAGLGFADVLDALNPLQHIPVVSWAYRALTGDGIGDAAKLVGGTLFGGPVGFALAAADTLWERTSGTDLGSTMVAWSKGNNRSAEEGGGLAVAGAAAPLASPPDERAVLVAAVQEVVPSERLTTPPAGPAWEIAAATLPQDQVDLLLRSVGLAAGNEAAAAPKGTNRNSVMPAVPAAPVGIAALAEVAPMPAAYRHTELANALAASQELRRAYGRF